MKRLLYCVGICVVATNLLFAQIPKLEYGINFPASVKWLGVDAAGNAYVAGVLQGAETYGTTTLFSNGGRDVFVMKVDPAGAILWAKSYGGPEDDEIHALNVDAAGNVHLAGEFLDEVDFDPGTGDNSVLNDSGEYYGYVLKLDTDGEFVWVSVFESTESNAVRGVASDASLNVYLTGHFTGTADLDPTGSDNLVVATAFDAFFVKLASDGSFVWAKTVGNGDYAEGVGATVDFTGTPIFTGHYLDNLDIDPGTGTETLNSVGEDNNIFMVKLDPADGAFVWGKGFGTSSVNEVNSVYADSQNNIYVTGAFYDQGDFDPGPGETILEATNEFSDVFIAKFHPSGTLLWAHAIGGTGGDWAYGIYSDGTDVYISGTFEQIVDFDPGPGNYIQSRIDQPDIFLLKLDGSGAFKWATQLGDEEYEEGGAITGDPDGNVYTSGEFHSEPTDMDPTGCNLLLDPETDPSYLLKFGTTPSPCLTIYLQPQDVNACKGDIVTFTVGATGVNLTYQWYGEGGEGEIDDPLSDNAVFSGTQTATLTVNTATMTLNSDDAYMVEVSGDGFPDLESDIVVVNVIGAPDAMSVSRCGPGEVTLKLTDLIPNAEYRWYTVPTGGTPIAGATGPNYTTPFLTTTTTYYVHRYLGSCEPPRAAVTASIVNCQPIPELVWANSIAPNGRINDMHVDRTNGTVYVTGFYTGGGDFDPGPDVTNLPGIGSTDVFVGKYTTAGELLWVGRVGGISQDDCNAITVDKDGNVLIAGYFLATGDFDPGSAVFNLTSAGSWDTFIVKLDPDGNFLWAKRFGGVPTTGDIPSAIRTDAAGNVYMAGNFTGTVDVDPGTPVVNVTSGGNTDGVILKLDPNGNYLNSFILRGQAFDSFTDIEVDGSGNIFGTGYFYANTDFDPGAGTSLEAGSPENNAFVLKWNSTGGLVWYKIFATAGSDQDGLSIDLDSDGNVVVGGSFEGTIDLDPGTGTDVHTTFDEEAFAVKLDPNGNYIWGKTIQTYTSAGYGFTAVHGTDVYLFGGFSSPVDMDPGAGVFNLTTAGQSDSFIMKMNKDGNFQWALQMGGPFTDALMTLGFDDEENIYTGGWLFDIGDYDPGPDIFDLEPIGSSGASFVKLGAPDPVLTITTEPESADACEGGIASFTVAATGAANIQYQWELFDGSVFVDVTDGGGFSGATTATLSVNTTGSFGDGTYRCRVSGDGVTDIHSEEVELTLVTTLTPPVTTGTTRCGAGAIIVNASGSTNGNYRWYATPVSTAVLADVDSYTAGISATTTYYVSVVSGACESTRTPVTATINPLPAAPNTVNVTRCTNTSTVLTASGASPGSYLWYDVATGGDPASTDSFTTPTLTATTTYYVSANMAGCESARTPLTVTIQSCANNQPPVITTTTSSTEIQGTATINLTPLLSDPDNNLDLSTLKIVVQPKSGATASIDQNGQLTVNYAGVSFSGEDELTIEICDIAGSCVQQVIKINVSGDVMAYNAVSPNGDGKNDVFHIAFIDVIEETRQNKVTIFNRWGDVVFETENYNNTTNVFSGNGKSGKELPSGTYFYRIEYQSGRKSETGYLSLKR